MNNGSLATWSNPNKGPNQVPFSYYASISEDCRLALNGAQIPSYRLMAAGCEGLIPGGGGYGSGGYGSGAAGGGYPGGGTGGYGAGGSWPGVTAGGGAGGYGPAGFGGSYGPSTNPAANLAYLQDLQMQNLQMLYAIEAYRKMMYANPLQYGIAPPAGAGAAPAPPPAAPAGPAPFSGGLDALLPPKADETPKPQPGLAGPPRN